MNRDIDVSQTVFLDSLIAKLIEQVLIRLDAVNLRDDSAIEARQLVSRTRPKFQNRSVGQTHQARYWRVFGFEGCEVNSCQFIVSHSI
jgi:hypothetical protein